MIKFVTIFVATLVYLTDAYYVRDYYWKDFDGAIPNDAFSVGENQYIGQGLTKDGRILIGAIHNSSSSSSFMAYDTKYNVSIAIKNSKKILCTKYPDSFFWLSNGIRTQENLIRVYGGVTQADGALPFGNLVIAKSADEGIVGFENVLSVENTIYYVVNGIAKKAYKYDKLYFNATAIL